MGRKQGCVIKTSSHATKKVMSHGEFIKRINKTLYFGNEFTDNDDDLPHALEMSKPLAEYASELFSDTHRGYTLNRLSSVDASSPQTVTPTTLIMALIYLDRLNITDPSYVRRITPQELFIVSMMISTKFYVGYDEEVYLSDWAEYGKMTDEYLKKLELKFLCAIEWNIYISNKDFFEKLSSIETTLARKQGLCRGWLTYSELVQMLPSFTLAKFLLNNITIIAVSYAAGVIAIAGAFFLAAQIPGTSLHRSQLKPNDTNLLAASEIDDNGNGTSQQSVTNLREHNDTTLVLNVEDELLKLERQYREETLRNSLLQRNNEIATNYRLTLPKQMLMAKINVNQKCAKYSQHYQQQGQWFANKEEYSEYRDMPVEIRKYYMDNQQPVIIKSRHYDSSEITCPRFKEQSYNKYSYDNSTVMALLWHYLAKTAQHTSFTRLPFVWLKFM